MIDVGNVLVLVSKILIMIVNIIFQGYLRDKII